jgi:hypothetical protein
MKLAKSIAVGILTLCVAALPAFAKQGGNQAAKAAEKASDSSKAGDKMANEIADAMTRPLAGETTASKSGSLPPGLAKKDKVPPGWSMGEKTGWSKENEHKDSFIDKVFKTLFGPKQ